MFRIVVKIKILSLLLLLSVVSLSLGSLSTLKDTYSILPQEKSYMSVTSGAVLWETGWINNFHRFSNNYPVLSTDRRGRSIVSYDRHKTDGFKKLVYTLFHRVPGSTNFTDFSTTDFIQTKDSFIVASLIAEIIIALDGIQINHKQIPYQDHNNSLAPLFKKLLILSDTKYSKISVQDFVKANLDALQLTHKGTYPPNMVQSVWLCFLYKTLEKMCGVDLLKNRQALAQYYKLVGNSLKTSLILNAHDGFNDIITSDKAYEKFADLLTHKDTYTTNLDSLLFYGIKTKNFPLLTSSSTVHYKPKTSTKSVSFSDCMENAIANFIRIMSYDTLRAQHTVAILEQRFKLKLSDKARDNLTPFLNNVQNHDIWAHLVSNNPYVPYLQSSTQQAMINPRFISLGNSAYNQKYQQAGYSVIKPEEFAFELRPSIRTFILVLNHILDLDLCDNIAQEVLRPDFITHYFPLLCKKLHIHGVVSNAPIMLGNTPLTNDENTSFMIDASDFEGKLEVHAQFTTLFPEISSLEAHHNFTTSAQHGHYDFIYDDTNSVRIVDTLKNYEAVSMPWQYTMLISHLLGNSYTNLENLASLDEKRLGTTPYLTGINLLCMALHDDAYVQDLIDIDITKLLLINDISFLYNLALYRTDWEAKAELLALLIKHCPQDNKVFYANNIKDMVHTILKNPHCSYDAVDAALYLLFKLKKYNLINTDEIMKLDFKDFKQIDDYKEFVMTIFNAVEQADQSEKIMSSAVKLIGITCWHAVHTLHNTTSLSDAIKTTIKQHCQNKDKEYPKYFFENVLHTLYINKLMNYQVVVETLLILNKNNALDPTQSVVLRDLITLIIKKHRGYVMQKTSLANIIQAMIQQEKYPQKNNLTINE